MAVSVGHIFLFLWCLLAVSVGAHHPAVYARSGSSAIASSSGSGRPATSATASSFSSSSSTSSHSSSHTSPPSSSSSPTSSSIFTLSSATTFPSSPSVTTTSLSSSTTTSSPLSLSSSSSPLPSSSSISKTSAVFVQSPSTTTPVAPPTTTAGFANLATTTDDSTTDEPTSTVPPSHVDAASSGFWGNKGAVGGTFVALALVILGILFAFAWRIRKRTQARNSARDTFFDTKSPLPLDRPERHSANPSMISLGNEPMDAHATPIPNYDLADQYLVDTDNYGISYPPTNHMNVPPTGQQQYYTPAAMESNNYYSQGNNHEQYNNYYSTDGGYNGNESGYSAAAPARQTSLSPHPFSHPSHTSGVPPIAMRNFAGRDSAYQQSIDSFYGAAGTAL